MLRLEAFNEVNIEQTAQRVPARLRRLFPWTMRISPEEWNLRQAEEDNNKRSFTQDIEKYKLLVEEAVPIKHALMPFRRAFAEKVAALPTNHRRYLAERLNWYVILLSTLKNPAMPWLEEYTYLQRSATADALWFDDLIAQNGVNGVAEDIERDYRYLGDEAHRDYRHRFRKKGLQTPELRVKPESFSLYNRFSYLLNNFYAHYCSRYDYADTIGWVSGLGIQKEMGDRTLQIINDLGIQPTDPDLDVTQKYLTYLPVATQLYREGYGSHDIAG